MATKYLDSKGTLWYNVKLPLQSCSLKELATFNISKEGLDDLYQEAQQLLDEETTAFRGGFDRKKWYDQQFAKRGTVTDRIASAAVHLSGPDFMFYLDSFSFLFDTARNDSHNFEAALKALSAIWPKLLPARPLKRFASQYFATLPTPAEGDKTTGDAESKESAGRKKVLLYWYIEDVLKRTYGQFLTLAEGSLKDKIMQRREAWLNVAGKLLSTVAELRHVTISMVVDKLGDPMSKISHKAYHLLLSMLSETSTTQSILLSEVEKVLFQKNCPMGTQKYCINVINQLVFNREERKLALKCVMTFLGLFKHLALQGSLDHSITDAIIVGLRRAFPFTGSDFSVLDPHVDALFVIANKGGNFHQRVSSLMLLYQLVTKGYTKLEDRYFRAMYHLLLVSPKQLPHSSQLTGFFAALYKSIRNDKDASRVAAFVHRLLQRCMFCNEAFVCAGLLLVAEAVNCHSTVRKMIRGLGAAPEASNNSSSKPTVGGRISALNVNAKELAVEDLAEDEEEHFIDADLSPLQQKQQRKAAAQTPAKAAAKPDTVVARNSATLMSPAGSKPNKDSKTTVYAPASREPQYSAAHTECLWILHALSKHSHPSVVKLAVLLLQGDDISFDTHPLDDMTMTNFLEMFVDGADGGSGAATGEEDARVAGTDAQGNSLTTKDTKGVAVFRRAVHVASIPRLTDDNFARLPAEQVDVSALFLHRFAYQRELFMEGRERTNLRKHWGLEEEEKEDEEAAARVAEGNAFDPAEEKKKTKKDPKKKLSEREQKKAAKEAESADYWEGENPEDNDDDANFDEKEYDYDPTEDANADNDFDWGDGDSGYGESEDEDEDEFGAIAARVGGKRDRRSANDDDEEDYGENSAGVAESAGFDNLMAGNNVRKTKKQKLEDTWLDSREGGNDQIAGGYRGGGGSRGFSGGRGGARGGGRGGARGGGRGGGRPKPYY